MKTILYMATSLNGNIAKINHETPWSQEEWKSYSKYVKRIKNIIIGRKTYEIMKKENEFEKIGNPLIIVLTNKDFKPENNVKFVKTPEEAITILEKYNFKETLISGGALLNKTFMEKNLINEIILDIEPFIFGNGIPLFAKNKKNLNLKLLKTKKLSKNTLQVHYSVIN